MKRDLQRLKSTSFDVVIIGAGIYGAAICRLLAMNGYRTALIERGDFGQATSANSLKILHGGLRYLQHLNLKRMRESVACRRELMQFSPHLTSPLSCLMPTRGHAMRSKQVMGAAFLLNDLISWDRNNGIAPSRRLKKGTTLGKKTFHEILPRLKLEDITGAANWFDGLAENTERIVLEHLLDAADSGADLANYVQADRIIVEQNQVTGVEVSDQLTKNRFSITAQLVINAAGPWFNELLQRSGLSVQPVSWAKAINIVVKKQLHPTHAIGLESREGYQDKDAVFKRGKRLYFFVPWRKHTMIGTTYTFFPDSADQLKVRQEDIDEIITEVNAICPDYALCRNDVSFVHCGLVPMSSTPGQESDVQLEKNSLIIDHEQENNCRGLISVKGIKYTTAPHAAREILHIVQQKQGVTPAGHQPAHIQQPDGKPKNDQDRLVRKYGRFANRVRAYIEQDNGDIPLNTDSEIVSGEILYFIHEEMAASLSDVIFRRSDLGTAQCPSDTLLSKICTLMAGELQWEPAEQARQLKKVHTHYAPLATHHN